MCFIQFSSRMDAEHREGVMKITAEGLLGSASKINSQRGTASEKDKGSVGAKSDRADIASRIDSRLVSLQSELNETQTELSRNQIVKEGLNRLIDEFNKGGNMKAVLDEVKFNDKKVLIDYLGDNGDALTMNILNEKNKEIDSLIVKDMNKLTKLQVESENIFASNLSKGSKHESVLGQISAMMENGGGNRSSSISNLNPDAVLRLIR